MNKSSKLHRIVCLTTLALLVSACGGGSKKALLFGTASIGAPLANTTVTITDINNRSVSTTTTTTGTFAIDASGMVGPLLLKTGPDPAGISRPLVAVLATAPQAGENGTANITPLTTAVAAMLTADGNPYAITAGTLAGLATNANVSAAIAKLDAVLANLLTFNGLTADFNPITTAYYANNVGADGLNSEVPLVAPANASLQLVPTSDTTQVLTLNSGSSTALVFSNPPVAANYLDWLSVELRRCLAVALGSRSADLTCSGILNANFIAQNGAPLETALETAYPDFAKPESVSATIGLPQTLSFQTDASTTPATQLASVRIPYTLPTSPTVTTGIAVMTVRQVPTGTTATVLPDGVAATWTINSK